MDRGSRIIAIGIVPSRVNDNLIGERKGQKQDDIHRQEEQKINKGRKKET